MTSLEATQLYFSEQMAAASYDNTTEIRTVDEARKHAAVVEGVYALVRHATQLGELEEFTSQLRLDTVRDAVQKIKTTAPITLQYQECQQLKLCILVASSLEIKIKSD